MRLVIETGGVRHHSLGQTADWVRHAEPARFELAWKYASADAANAGASLRVSGRGSSPG